MIPRLAPKLTKKCIELPSFSPMRVCLAAKTLSHSVARGILTHVSFNSLPSTSVHTAEFIENFDTLFDIFNSSQYNSPKIYRRCLNDKNNHFQKLNELTDFLQNLKISNGKSRNSVCIIGWLENISALKLLWADLIVSLT